MIDSPKFEGRREVNTDYARAAAVFTVNETKLSGITDSIESSHGVTCPVNYECLSNIYEKLMYELAMVTGPRTAVTCRLPDSGKDYPMRTNEGILSLMRVSVNKNPTNLVYFLQLCRFLAVYNVLLSLKNELKRAGLWSPEMIEYLTLHKGDLSNCPLMPKELNQGKAFSYLPGKKTV